MSMVMNLLTSLLLYFGSGRSSRFSASLLRAMLYSTISLLLRPLRAVFRSALSPVANAGTVQGSSQYVISHAGKVFDPAPPDENDRMLLQVVSHAGDVGRHLHGVGKPHPGNFPEGRVRLFRCRRIDPHTDAALLRTALQRRALRLPLDLLAPFPDQLSNRRHFSSSNNKALQNPPCGGEPDEFTRDGSSCQGLRNRTEASLPAGQGSTMLPHKDFSCKVDYFHSTHYNW